MTRSQLAKEEALKPQTAKEVAKRPEVLVLLCLHKKSVWIQAAFIEAKFEFILTWKRADATWFVHLSETTPSLTPEGHFYVFL